jgi:orotidine-5'-phosphate decarboxylase
MTFIEMLRARWRAADTLLCVGLDPDPARFPSSFHGVPGAIAAFCREIVDATADLVCAFKPQIAHFAALSAESELAWLIHYIRSNHSDVPVVLDAKRGDIGSTAEHYAAEAFKRYGAHAVTLSPYMGFDSLQPFLAYPDCGAFVLARTSNAGGDDLQMLDVGGERLYERVTRLTATRWNTNGQLGLVVGATYPAELARVRALAPDLPILVPGVGAQGGDVEATVRAGVSADGTGMLVNSSRAILYASTDHDFAERARAAALATRDQINRYRTALTA